MIALYADKSPYEEENEVSKRGSEWIQKEIGRIQIGRDQAELSQDPKDSFRVFLGGSWGRAGRWRRC